MSYKAITIMTTLKPLKSFSIYILLLLFTDAVYAQYASVAGTYSGVIPCADCEGIKYQLVLKADGNFNEVLIYKGKNNLPVTNTGKYSVKNNSVSLEKATPGMTYFIKVAAGLQMLDANGKEIEGSSAYRYILKNISQPIKAENNLSAINLQKHDSSIEFYASGNEPNWTLDIDFHKAMYFKTADGKTITTPAVKGVKAADANLTMYSAKSFDGLLQVQILQQECKNKLTGDVSQYSVSVVAQTAIDTKAITYEGCGRYTPDYRLNGQWTLSTIGTNEKADAKNYTQGLPRIFIDVDAKTINGFGGCNHFYCGLHQEQNRIRFLNITGTLMACNDDGKEAAFLKTLQLVINYKIDDGKLVLSNPDGVKLTFEKKKEQLKSNSMDRLNDIWILESRNGIIPDKKIYSKGLPQLQFQIADMKYTGNTGCNSFSGKFEATAKTIKIVEGPITRMFCEGINESDYLKDLHNATGYKIENNHLTLMLNGKPTLIYKKVD